MGGIQGPDWIGGRQKAREPSKGRGKTNWWLNRGMSAGAMADLRVHTVEI